MNPSEMGSDSRWKAALWISFALILAIFGFGSGVSVPFLEAEVPSSKALANFSVEGAWKGLIHEELGLTLLAAGGLLSVRMFVKPRAARIGLMIIGLLMPVVIKEPVFIGVMFVAPLIVARALLGSPDGEFYGEQILPAAAVGLWMLLCLIDVIRESRHGLKERSARLTRPQPHPDHPNRRCCGENGNPNHLKPDPWTHFFSSPR